MNGVRRLSRVEPAHVAQLADLLRDCVEGGASVGFMLPLSRERAEAFWERIAEGVAAGERVLLVAEDEHGLCGTVQLVLGLPENQPHRADVSKMLVHRRARRRGLGAALMQATEATARELGRTVLVLDTASDDARRLYERAGWVRVGDVPAFALLPEGGACATTYYYRGLDTPRASPAAPAALEPPTIAALAPGDRDAWEALARGYKTFYRTAVTPAEYENAWNRLLARDGVLALGAKSDGRLVGIAHYLFHASVWAPKACYLQDLFVEEAARGRGIARALIEAVAQAARDAGAGRYYWLTQAHNTAARALYDRVGRHNGFIRYDFPL